MRIPEALLVDLLSSAGVILEHDEPFWYAVDSHTAEPLATGSDAIRVARDALTALRARLDIAEGVPERSRALGESS